jgi:hypothetical protein
MATRSSLGTYHEIYEHYLIVSGHIQEMEEAIQSFCQACSYSTYSIHTDLS